MANKQLHITNGDELAQKIRELNLEGEIIVWREMLCEGPTTYKLGSRQFNALRQKFLQENYNVSPEDYKSQFLNELKKLKNVNGSEEIVLWFEFDLFSHLNMMAAISHLLENHEELPPVNLVCSKKLKGDKEFKSLSLLSLEELNNHYQQRIHLNVDDLEISNLIWQIYNGENPQKLKALIKQKTNFEYLSSCVRAHIERFPNAQTGLNSLERNILKLINTNDITSMNQLLGYALEYQGYFGYGDLQIQRMIDRLNLFYEDKDGKIILTSEGNEALNASKNFYRQMKTEEYLGGVKIYDFLYDSESHNILKL